MTDREKRQKRKQCGENTTQFRARSKPIDSSISNIVETPDTIFPQAHQSIKEGKSSGRKKVRKDRAQAYRD